MLGAGTGVGASRASPERVTAKVLIHADAPRRMSAVGHEEGVLELLGGGLLSTRLRGNEDRGGEDPRERAPTAVPNGVALGPATQVEISGLEVRFFVPFATGLPSDHWLQAFRQHQPEWPGHLAPPRLDESRGVRLGPFPVSAIEEHVQTLKARVAETNRIYFDEIEPELRRRREEARRAEEDERRIQAEVGAALKRLLG